MPVTGWKLDPNERAQLLERCRGRRAVESYDVIAERGWEPLPTPVSIHIEPARLG